ncbi:MAG: molybdopterin-dependent oxidoreductase [candidate division KSB1 bacterium]|nr:molybdopterin-dependent oxidoreductase [candidate division KSB1 bacterium]
MNKINRRDFLKLGALGATAIQFSGLVPIFGTRGRNVSIFSNDFRKSVTTICDLCPARCGVLGFLNYERLAAVQGNPKHLNNRGRICARGIAGMNLVYDPERILYPMKRTGKRGDGKWQKISWDEALNELTMRLKAVQNQNRGEAFVFHADRFQISGLTRRFLDNFKPVTILTDDGYEHPNKTMAQQKTWGESCEVIDAANCRYFLAFGSNPFESHPFFINFNQRLIDGRIDRHARLVTVDPRMSNTAGRSDEWIPIKPGTDAMLALAMANVIMQKNLYNAQFISQWTNVSVADLKSYLAQFTVEKAAEITQVPAETIERIAVEFATTQPGVAFSGGGVVDHVNGVENERCIMLLNAIVGNIDGQGGYCLPRKYQLKDFDPDQKLADEQNPIEFLKSIQSKKQKVDLYFAYKTNPAYEHPDCHFTQSVLKDESLLPFTVVMDTVMSETAALADLVLPATTFLESWSLDSAPSFEMIPFVTLGQPVIQPQGESKPLYELCLSLAQRMGGGFAAMVNHSNVEDYIKAIVTQVPGLAYDRLKKNGIWYQENQKAEYQIYRTRGFNTPSKKFEIAQRRNGLTALPSYQPIQEHIHLAKDELILIPFNVNVMRSDLANAKWLAEIHHANAALINSKTARALKIKPGDDIILESSAGELKVKAHVTEGVHPEIIAIANGCGHWEFGRIARAEKFDSDDPDTKFIWWPKKGKFGVHPNWVIAAATDPMGKGQAWMDTKVKVRKA